MSRYIEGVLRGKYVVWKNVQKVYNRDYFIHSTYYLQGNPATATHRTIRIILEEKDKNRRSNLKIAIQRKDPYKDIDWDLVGKHIHTRVPYGASYNIGAHPVIIWQNQLDGRWMMATGYGISVGFELAIRKDYEWRLRRTPLIGWIYYFGPGLRRNAHNGPDSERAEMKGMKLLGNEYIMSWDNVKLQIWGSMSSNNEGMKMGNVYWKPLIEMDGAIKVGGVSVVHSTPPSTMMTERWKEWCLRELRKGRGIVFKTRGGRWRTDPYLTVWQHGIKTSIITKEVYDKRLADMILNTSHDKNGRIIYTRQ